MTITLTKTKAALAVVVLALLIPATAYAANNFTDVPAGKFYAEPVDWAFNNDITTGKTATSFAPEDNVTRGETVTFLKRYNDNIVEPADAALQADIATNTADIATNTADIATNTADIATNTADIAGLPEGPTLYIAREMDGIYQNMPTGVATDLGSLDVPAGTYLFNARVLLNNNGSDGALDCTLAAGADQDDFSGGGITIGSTDDREIATLQFAGTLAADGTVNLTCTSNTSASNAGRVVISALKLDNFTETVINPAP